ncbi:flagellar basal body L-ring protein FlgH [Roseateles sp. DAIF2]|uniref:flagellar basal body L-ring protein FlgH n=1 Tax=Roseateles sp. DAIF2 TaxID=2714952 RepID=UPI0018A282B9|nr:flagellar basal body L-ring protein FlgH [Roseateles sp. DAIF2]QPF73149.1 flagellar basal body L-ring protein FlgH [Roseateles sp. DAIF2]
MKLALSLTLLAAALGGCAAVQPPPRVELQNTPVVQLPLQPAAVPVNGAIYQSVSYRPLFEDHRARLVGDTVTIQIVERITATQSSSSALDKKGQLSGSISALPGIAPNSFGRASAAATSATTAAGKGSNQNTNEFSGSITAVVTAVLPNGHLMLTGEKQIGVNSNVDVLRFSGQVDPRLIQQGNTVSSAQVANVRVEQRGRGALEQTHEIGWLSRFFLSLSPT